MKDIFKKEIEVGDTVAFNHPGYKFLTTGTVVKINDKMIRVEYTPYYNKEKIEQTSEYPRNVVKK